MENTTMTMDLFPVSDAMPRRALVTGGAARLGRALVLMLAETGFDVAIHYRGNAVRARETQAEVEALGRRAVLLHADLAREEETAPLTEQAMQALGGPLGVLVNNASTFERDEWDDASLESWMQHMKPNLRAPFVLMQLSPRRCQQGRRAWC